MKRHALTLLAIAPLAACQHAAAPESAAPTPTAVATAPAGATPAERGLAFAQQHCSQCHAVTPDAVSPNPDSPPFPMIGNTPDVTAETLTTWLRNSHDFPQEMYFVIADERIDDLAAYILSLRSKDYEPPVQ